MQTCPPERQDPDTPTRTQAPVPFTRKPTQPTEPTLATGGRQQKTKGITNLQPAKRRPQTQSQKPNEKTEKHTAVKEQSKNPPDQKNVEEIGSLPEK